MPRPVPIAVPGSEYCIVDFYGADGHWIESMLQTGRADYIEPNLHKLARRLIEQPCPAIVLRHFHPSGIATPSPADIAATRAIARFVRLLGTRLHDHVIEADPDRFSFRAEGLI